MNGSTYFFNKDDLKDKHRLHLQRNELWFEREGDNYSGEIPRINPFYLINTLPQKNIINAMMRYSRSDKKYRSFEIDVNGDNAHSVDLMQALCCVTNMHLNEGKRGFYLRKKTEHLVMNDYDGAKKNYMYKTHRVGIRGSVISVSYTHLTLPTIYSV